MFETCCIYGAMPTKHKPIDNSLIIAADKGYDNLRALGINPHIAVGDFDSLGFIPTDCETVQHPVRKDDTDMMLAVKIGLQRGCKEFYLYGGMGGSFDHTLANLQTLSFIAENGGRGYLECDTQNLTVIKDSSFEISGENGRISVFALTECEGVTIKGLQYELDNADLSPSFPLGVSNSFIGKKASISVENGTLAIYWESL